MRTSYVLGALLALAGALASPASPAAEAPAGCAAHVGPNSVFFETDRQPATDVQIFTGARGLRADRLPVVTSGVIDGPASPATTFRCASREAMLAALPRAFNPKRGRTLLVYVHGYHTTFKAAADDALALRRGLNFPGPILLYSWPSKATSRLVYLNDESNATWATTHFRDLIAAVLHMYPNMPISFASHSLGSRLAVDGISMVRHFGCKTCVGRVVFFAPDIDAQRLLGELAALGRCNGKPPQSPVASAPVLLYVSNKDAALAQSQRLHGQQRAGQATNEMIVCKGVDTVDVSYLKFADRAGHTYQTDPRVMADARAAFAGVPPTSPSRKLTPATRPDGKYYELR